MRNSNIIEEGIFGTDHNGVEGWFCWRFAMGCSGKLVTLVHEDEHGNEIDLKETGGQPPLRSRPVLRVPCSLLYREKEGFFGIQTRPFKRSSRGKEYLSQSKSFTKAADRLREKEGKGYEYVDPDAAGIMECLADEFHIANAVAIDDILITKHEPHREWGDFRSYHLLPTVVQCRSCRAKSRIRGIRGVRQVINGRLLE